MCVCAWCVLFSQDFTDSPPESSQVIVVMDSFKSKIIRLRVRPAAHVIFTYSLQHDAVAERNIAVVCAACELCEHIRHRPTQPFILSRSINE